MKSTIAEIVNSYFIKLLCVKIEQNESEWMIWVFRLVFENLEGWRVKYEGWKVIDFSEEWRCMVMYDDARLMNAGLGTAQLSN